MWFYNLLTEGYLWGNVTQKKYIFCFKFQHVFLFMLVSNVFDISSLPILIDAAHSDMDVVTILVGNKTDLKHAREVSTAEGQALAEAQGLFFMEASALDSSNVAAAFQTVVKEIYSILSRKVFQSQEQKRSDLHSLSNGKAVVLQGETNETSSGGGRCCSS
jgi:GTPase SAR1 family protein